MPSHSLFTLTLTLQLDHIFEDCNIAVGHYDPVAGGDINHAYCLHTTDGKYFLKVNDEDRYPQMFDKEVNGLEALRNASTLTVPKVIKNGTVAGAQYLLLEWLDKGTPRYGFWQHFGTALAVMHKTPRPFFGWTEDNFIGSLVQPNTAYTAWADFYTQCRIMPLVKRLADSSAFTARDVKATEHLCNKLPSLFPAEPPSLLHGDLWAGNFMVTAEGGAAIFDPATYYGHREMDIAMTKLFGGFDIEFYKAYSDTYPLEKGWEQRLPLAQLYPLLVHAVLFGGHYVQDVRNIIHAY
jgi:fructosamine-3-kinase